MYKALHSHFESEMHKISLCTQVKVQHGAALQFLWLQQFKNLNNCNMVQVVNWFYELPDPYPLDQEVAVVRQTSQIVDESGRPVPLSEVLPPDSFEHELVLLLSSS